jgi:hypothetical protein
MKRSLRNGFGERIRLFNVGRFLLSWELDGA